MNGRAQTRCRIAHYVRGLFWYIFLSIVFVTPLWTRLIFRLQVIDLSLNQGILNKKVTLFHCFPEAKLSNISFQLPFPFSLVMNLYLFDKTWSNIKIINKLKYFKIITYNIKMCLFKSKNLFTTKSIFKTFLLYF